MSAPHRPAASPGAAPPVRRARLDSLTGLRALAAAVVFGIHATGPRAPGAVRHLTEQGAVGVSFFYVLSGFVLTWSASDAQGVRAFARHRAARILPLYWLACLLALAVVTGEGGSVVKAVVGFTLLQAWVPDVSVYFGGNEVGWSLAAEAFFYALLPFLLPWLRRLSTAAVTRVAVACAVFGVLWPAVVHAGLGSRPVAFWLTNILPPVRAPEFVLGVCLAVLVIAGAAPRVPLRVAGPLALAAYVAAGFVPDHLQRVPVTLVPFALLILAAAQADAGRGRTPFAGRVLVRLGTWSYAFYLLHQLVIRARDVVFGPSDGGAAELLVVTVATLAVAVAVSALAFAAVERPLERRLRGGHVPGGKARPFQLD